LPRDRDLPVYVVTVVGIVTWAVPSTSNTAGEMPVRSILAKLRRFRISELRRAHEYWAARFRLSFGRMNTGETRLYDCAGLGVAQ
jgi:hypothetical protein